MKNSGSSNLSHPENAPKRGKSWTIMKSISSGSHVLLFWLHLLLLFTVFLLYLQHLKPFPTPQLEISDSSSLSHPENTPKRGKSWNIRENNENTSLGKEAGTFSFSGLLLLLLFTCFLLYLQHLKPFPTPYLKISGSSNLNHPKNASKSGKYWKK